MMIGQEVEPSGEYVPIQCVHSVIQGEGIPRVSGIGHRGQSGRQLCRTQKGQLCANCCSMIFFINPTVSAVDIVVLYHDVV